MMEGVGITRGMAIAIDDLLDNCAQIKAGQEVVLAAHIDGLYGGDNLVDPQVIGWIQAAVHSRGANATILWIDEPARMHAWRVPPVYMAALKSCDVFINHSFDLVTEELKPIVNAATEAGTTLCRNLAGTPGLLNSAWAQTPLELVSEIRYQACVPFGKGGMPYQISDEKGTHIEGMIEPPSHPRFPTYLQRRNDGPGHRPFPEWVFPPINVSHTNGTIVFDRMLSWWSRYIGISPVFADPVRLTMEENRITRIEGKDEADALRRFLKSLEPKLGIDVYNFPEIHSGVHPQANVPPQQCLHPLWRRIIEHSDACNIHFHIGAPWPGPDYPYWLHITGDLRTATWKVGDSLIHDRGHLTALDHPKVKEIADKYPDRPGLTPWPRNF
jgi:hypothetical protein